MSGSVLGRPGRLALTLGGLLVTALAAAPPASAVCVDPSKPLQATIKFQDAPANVTFFPPPAATPIKIVLQVENCSGGPVLTAAGFSSTDFFRRLYFTDPAGNSIINKNEEKIHAFDTAFFCNTRNGVLQVPTISVTPVEVLAGPQGQPAVPHFFREYLIDTAKFYELTLSGQYRVNARIDILTFKTTDASAVFADCGELPGATVVNVGAVTGRQELTIVSNTLEFLIGGASCAGDPSAILTRAVDASGTNHGVPTYTKLQAAYNDAADAANEVIGLFGNLSENVVLGGAKTLKITQCEAAQITAAVSSKPVVDITSTGKLTVVGPGTVGGVVGWRVGGNGGHALKSVKASGASQYGIQLLSDGNTVEGASVQKSTRHGVFVSGSGNRISGTTAQSSGQNGFNVAGGSNQLDASTVATGNTANGFKISGAGNTIRNSTAQSNGQDGFNSASTGANTLFDSNISNRNTNDGFEIAGTNNTLTNNQSNTSDAGGTNENKGAEYRLNAVAIDGGGNMADKIGIPKASAPQKCAFFPAKGICE